MAKKPLIKTIFAKERIITAATEEARELYNSNRFGSLINDKVQLSLLEALYLLEKDKIEVFDGRNKKLDFESFVSRARRLDKKFWNRFVVFKDLRDRGYIVKTALKFGADFRVYER
ncbi:tRNA-intron lyase, partial [Candidatus Woesearchaeota archaeon]|nr:tRNA-intron lyase [Candidatus Woesearchaeota archaeon]